MKGRAFSAKHRRFIATLPCIRCGDDSATSDREAAHYRRADARIAKPITGNSTKPHDWFIVPLCTPCHRTGPRAQHKIEEFAFWHLGPDPVLIALALYANSGDYMACAEICAAALRAWPSQTTQVGKHG